MRSLLRVAFASCVKCTPQPSLLVMALQQVNNGYPTMEASRSHTLIFGTLTAVSLDKKLQVAAGSGNDYYYQWVRGGGSERSAS